MLLKDYIDILRDGELKAISSSEEAQSDRTVISHINMGLIELCKRFPIFYKEHIIELKDTDQIYTLPRDMMTISACYNGNGEAVGINETGWEYGVFTLTSSKLQVPFARDNESLWIIYRASPQIRKVDWASDLGELHLFNKDKLQPTATDVGEFECELNIADSLLEPLGFYVAWRASMATLATVPNDSKTMYQAFETSCARVVFDASITPEGVWAEKLYALQRKGLDTPLHYYDAVGE